MLLDLLLYEKPTLVSNAFELLEQSYSQHRRLMEYLLEIQLLDDEAKIEILNNSVRIKSSLSKLASRAEEWYAKKDRESIILAEQAIANID